MYDAGLKAPRRSAMSVFCSYAAALLIGGCGQQSDGTPQQPVNAFGGGGRTNYWGDVIFAKTATSVWKDIDSMASATKEEAGTIVRPAAYGNDDIVFANVHGVIRRVISTTSIWKSELPKGVVPASAPVIDARGNIYLMGSDARLYCYANTGVLQWATGIAKQQPGLIFGEPLALYEGVVVSSSMGDVVKVDPKGAVVWRHTTGLGSIGAPALMEDQSIVVATTSDDYSLADSLVVIDANGSRRWTRAFPAGRLRHTPAVAGKTIVITDSQNNGSSTRHALHAFDALGNILWSQELPMYPVGVAVADSLIYVAENGEGTGAASLEGRAQKSALEIYSLRDGSKVRRTDLDAAAVHPPLVSSGNVVVLARQDNAAGAYFFTPDGTFFDVISMGEFPPANMRVCVSPEGAMYFAGSKSDVIIKIGSSVIGNVLPF